jgi:AcrR family transcriptional regulator
MQADPGRLGTSSLGRPRRTRISDQETERRMLATAAEAVAEAGLAVSLDHIRLEDVIREAGVSRSAAYRRWPTKDAFLGDLLLELARGQAPMAALGTEEADASIRRVLTERLDELDTIEGRRHAVAAVVRETAEHEFRRITTSPQWRTYLALTATFAGLPEGGLRDQVGEALATSERTLTEGVARSHDAVARLLGLRATQVGIEDIAHLVNAQMRGMVVKALVQPELAERTSPVGFTGADEEWSLVAVGVAALVLAFLEPDPDWDAVRLQETLRNNEPVLEQSAAVS